MATQFIFPRVKDFIENFSIRAEGTLWIAGVKGPEDLRKKFKDYDIHKEFGNARVEDDNCGNYRLRFTRKGEKFKYLLSFRKDDVQLEPNR